MHALKDFLKLESASGILLMVAAVLAMLLVNSPLKFLYDIFIEMPVEVRIGRVHIAKPLLLWINDGLMAVFFFLVGLEVKREILEGELSDTRTVILPACGALGGMAVPAGIYVWMNWSDTIALQGWAIPTATDIAFSLGILALLGSRVPLALKVFLMTLAIFDDIGAIVIIALFYSGQLSMGALIVACGCTIALWVLSARRVVELVPYISIGIIMWVAVLKSGVHATLVGVILALFIPLRDPGHPERSPLRELEHDLHTTVAFVILPLFAFANAGISLSGLSVADILHPVPLGIALGLIVGKQIGVFGFCWLGVKLGIAKLPENMNWAHMYGVALLCGVGFTMSLFISSLAFEQTGVDLLFSDRLGVILGSLLAGGAGYAVLRATLRENNPVQPGG